MSSTEHDFSLRNWMRSPINGLSFVMIWGGLIATMVTGHNGFFCFLGAGLLGPTLLRELGLIRWEDEFQRDTMTRAALHAFLAVGTLLVSIMALKGFSGTYNEEFKDFKDAIPASSVFLLLVLSWYLSRLFLYWGARKAAFRIWGATGVIWLLLATVTFLTIDNEQLQLTTSTVIKSLFPALPCFALAWISLHKPRVAGWLGLAFFIWYIYGTGLWQMVDASLPWEIGLDIATLVVVPIGAPAVALLASRKP